MYQAPTTPEITEREVINAKKVRALSGECLVLLENDGTLPISRTQKIALYGNGARYTIKGGTGSGDVYTRDFMTVEQGLLAAGFTITTTAWLDRYTATMQEAERCYHERANEWARENNSQPFMYEFLNPMRQPSIDKITEEDIVASDTDTAIYVLSRNSGEGADRKLKMGDYLLQKSERKAIALLAQRYAHMVLILNVGGMIDLSELKQIEGINSILLMSQLGSQGGNILADVLVGDVTPSGKLSDSWMMRYEDYPSHDTFSHINHEVNDEYYTEGSFVGYRYFDTFGFEPVYPFGYGLSYTDFTINVGSGRLDGTKLIVTATVINTGNYPGKEVVQAYVSAPYGNLSKPYQTLQGFAKTRLLEKDAFETVSICMDVRQFASYDEVRACYVLEAGDYIIRIGNQSRDTTVSCVVRILEEIITEQCKNCMNARTEDWKELQGYAGAEDTSPYQILTLQEPIETIVHAYREIPTEPLLEEAFAGSFHEVLNKSASLEAFVASLSVEELMHLCIGQFNEGEGSKDVIGDAGVHVPGAAGETTGILEHRDVKPMVLADGPAGLRLTPHYEREGKDYYQYCTAIPIATALAQSWNLDLIEEIGNIVGDEMELFDVKLWLAPGMNIHRNPLCGRNFEYYSEDPYLSGMCAAADTKGVQKHIGKGTTIKHFAANNQEDNRMYVNDHISEKALREIYLKGFEIAVKEAKPLSIMTSYNLINGLHSANNYGMITDILRGEWGFEGLVMTDWLTCSSLSKEFYHLEERKYDKSFANQCILAGNDLVMPGGNEEYGEMKRAYEAGTLSLRALQECAMRVLKLQFNNIN